MRYRKAQKNRLKMLSADRISPNRSYTRAGLNSCKRQPRTKRTRVVTYACTPFACTKQSIHCVAAAPEHVVLSVLWLQEQKCCRVSASQGCAQNLMHPGMPAPYYAAQWVGMLYLVDRRISFW